MKFSGRTDDYTPYGQKIKIYDKSKKKKNTDNPVTNIRFHPYPWLLNDQSFQAMCGRETRQDPHLNIDDRHQVQAFDHSFA